MENILERIVHDFAREYPQPGQPPQLELSVGTHDPNRDNSKFRLSDAGRCRLMRFYKRQGKEGVKDTPGNVLLQMQAGNLLHGYIERAAHDMGCLLASEERLEDNDRIGHFDLIIDNPFNGQNASSPILYDVKTITNKKAYYMTRNGAGADEQHIAQLVSYALMYDGHLTELRIAYVVRDTLEFREVRVDMQRHEEDVLSDWAILISAWNRNEPPAANPQRWECQYCAYGHDCPSAIRR